ncbi:MAG TPA: ATP-binding cassette domain-containing protein [Streptosporangiaceae bacterium]|jgi:ABC-type branched-subunit amino acid transport system ATPase component|nr:ATP-binding cassette domain-containing protein [Streptosporangiaceae bacterium]
MTSATAETITSTEETLRLDGITVRFGGLTALSDISLTTTAGEFVGLIGPNGSGKTTMLNVITGLVKASAGSLSICSSACNRVSVHRRVHLGLARTFQRAMLFPEMTVAEHLALARDIPNLWGRLTSRAGDSGPSDSDELTAFVAAEPWGLRPGDRLSGLSLGGLRIVELAMALASQPKLLLLDEPLSGLDQTERDSFGDALLDVQRRLGVTVVLIEHDVESVLRLAQRLVVLDFGVKIADGPAAEIIKDPRVRDAYFGGDEE